MPSPVPCLDADSLGWIEEAALLRLDPPLNLRGMAASPLRERLSALRGGRGALPPTDTIRRGPIAQWHHQVMDDDAEARSAQEAAFGSAMKEIYRRAKAEAGYTATYFAQMLSEHGPLMTARRLALSTKPSEGFTALWERHRLDLTVEAHMIQGRFALLFTEEERDAASRRLEEYGYRPDCSPGE